MSRSTVPARLTLRVTLLAALGAGLAACPLPGEAPATPADAGTIAPGPTSPPPQGTWQAATTADAVRAGFQTLALAGGSWTETGRSDGQPPSGAYTLPASIDIDPSFGSPPAGMHGPYLEIDNDPDGDGEWVYGWSEAADGSALTLTLYAARAGMGLRWATPTTIALVAP